jgi:protease-4
MLLRLFGNFFRLLFLPVLLWRRARVLPHGAFVHLTIDGAVADIVRAPRFWEQWRPKKASLVEIGKLVDEIVRDERARGLVVTLRSFSGGMASATSLRAVLARVVDGKRELVVVLPLGADTKELYVASAGTRVLVGPQAHVSPVGFAMSVAYVKRALDRAGVEPEVYAKGKFKSAGEQLVRESMGEAQKEQLDAILDAFYGELVAGIAKGRKLEPNRVRALIDAAPYRAEDAIAAGLVDGAAYEDEVAGLIASDAKKRARIVDAGRYLRVIRAARFRPLRVRACIGVITVHGAIASEASFAQGFSERGAIDERVIAAVRLARKDPRVRAVVLHVDSPGGSALASDRMHHEIERLAAEKPLVACFADVAASGGYYVAACAHSIVAQPTTITGSIGVIAARIVVEPLLAKLGIATSVLKRGIHADAHRASRHSTDEERVAFEKELDGTYRAFVSIVARGRKRSFDDIERVAQGRVWSGVDGAREGLVDVLGGFHAACDGARDLAAKTMGAARAKKLEPMVVRGGRHAGPPLDPKAEVACEALAIVARIARASGVDLSITAALSSDPRDRLLAWSKEAEALQTPSSVFIDASSAGVNGY